MKNKKEQSSPTKFNLSSKGYTTKEKLNGSIMYASIYYHFRYQKHPQALQSHQSVPVHGPAPFFTNINNKNNQAFKNGDSEVGNLYKGISIQTLSIFFAFSISNRSG